MGEIFANFSAAGKRDSLNELFIKHDSGPAISSTPSTMSDIGISS